MESESQDYCECPYFCGELLSSVPVELKGKIVYIMHNIPQKKYSDPLSVCEGVLEEIEGMEEINSFQYAVILKQLCFALLKASDYDSPIKLLKKRLEYLKKEDFSTLLIMGTMYEKKGEYQNALTTFQRALDVILQNEEDHLRSSYCFLKLATSKWHLEDPKYSVEYIRKAQQSFAQSCISDKINNASEEELEFLMDYYRTMGYLEKLNNNYPESTAYYLKVLDLCKNRGSKVQWLKVITRVSSGYALVGNESGVIEKNKTAVDILKNMLENSSYISAHALQIIHIFTRLAFSYRRIWKWIDALNIHRKTLDMARNILGEDHPEVARIAADAAIASQYAKLHRESSQFADIFEESLEKCDYKNNSGKMKLYVRELTDALSNFAYYNTIQSNFSMAEEYYKEAIDINTKVYGEDSLRTAKVMRFLGRMYSKWGKREEAKDCFLKSLASVEHYQPNNKKLQEELKQEMDSSGMKKRKQRRKKLHV